ncbi:uncharacterized protein LOC129771224 [Toxorhynchites rutilus septentrionalis]|nr:uncharacterized protein LOC129771224 [Toxorhynchites rutilus septentrionalis]
MKHMTHVGKLDELPSRQDQVVCYLPHHPVLKESSSTTKLRVVFDGSAKTSKNFSLNEALLTGPVIQDDLLVLMLRFRKHAVALVADVEKMYRQIKIHPTDASLQRILWRFSSSDPVQVYELQTVTYGLSPSSFIATRVLQQLATDVGKRYKRAAGVVTEDFYMDDLLSGAETIDEAKHLRYEIQTLLAEGGFQLRKWSSNCQEVLADMSSGELQTTTTLYFENESKVKTLGVAWETKTDQFCIDIQPNVNDGYWTKRKIFSSIAQLYDPLGLVSPVVTWAKIRMQRLWLASLEWDERVPDEIEIHWKEFSNQLSLLRMFKVPRFVFLQNSVETQFHVFCDASESAYGTCIYARSMNVTGKVKTELITSKSRVAPLKRISLPRLELCAALLGAKLYHKTACALRMKDTPCWLWSDSIVTLYWIRAPSNTWQTFIGNRTAEIQRLTSGKSWKHIKGTDNPADVVSRGMLPSEFMKSTMWLHGPDWLREEEERWPKNTQLIPPSEEILERKRTVMVAQVVLKPFFLFERYSNFQRLLRITAYILRFLNCCRSKQRKSHEEFLSAMELVQAKECLVRSAQYEAFADEKRALEYKRPLSMKSNLKHLLPFVDDRGVLRVGGRLAQSTESYKTKHPMILPDKHPLSRMTLSAMRQEFWPIRGKLLVHYVCRNCQNCFRLNPVPVTQPVGQLPTSRVVPSRPFAITGVDYCGPVYLKPVHRRAAPKKAFIAIFICFSSKAVHIELVSDLSTNAFIAALRRFIARRGLPNEIHSDNGTNFRGANNALADLYHLLNRKSSQEIFFNECGAKGITWKFIPPRAPSFGGLWEAAVKTAKSTMVKTIGNSKLSYEDFVTVLTQIEANMNTRPLTPLSEDPSELDVLTPGHFLTGSSLAALPDPDYSNIPLNRLKHYQQLQQLVQNHWKRWKKEYLTEVNNQRKKTSIPVSLRIGQMVLLQEDNKSSIAWPLARIVAVHPGEDNIIRVVTVKTANGIYKRPTSRIFPLPSDESIGVQESVQ